MLADKLSMIYANMVWEGIFMGMTQTIYESIGGEQTVRELVDRFYDLMDTMPEAAGIRALHPETLDHSREKLFMFLSGWMGGPPLYIERFGHPRLRARHLPFPIGESERDQWMLCMNRALEEVVENGLIRVQIGRSFAQLADFMRNKES
jgi:hemoglobin